MTRPADKPPKQPRFRQKAGTNPSQTKIVQQAVEDMSSRPRLSADEGHLGANGYRCASIPSKTRRATSSSETQPSRTSRADEAIMSAPTRIILSVNWIAGAPAASDFPDATPDAVSGYHCSVKCSIPKEIQAYR
jgi:hypothetical protein